MKSVLDEEEISKTITKLYFYENEEKNNFQNILRSLEKMTNCYNTQNTRIIKQNNDNIKKMLSNRINYEEVSIKVLTSNHDKYSKTKYIVAEIFKVN